MKLTTAVSFARRLNHKEPLVMDDFRKHGLSCYPPPALQTLHRAATEAIAAYDDLVATIRADIARRHPGLPLPASAHQAPRGMLVHHAFARLLARVLPLGRAGLLPHSIKWVVLDGQVAHSADEVRWVLGQVRDSAGSGAAERWGAVITALERNAERVRHDLGEAKEGIARALDQQSREEVERERRMRQRQHECRNQSLPKEKCASSGAPTVLAAAAEDDAWGGPGLHWEPSAPDWDDDWPGEDYAPFSGEPTIGGEPLELVGATWPGEDDDPDEVPHIASMSH